VTAAPSPKPESAPGRPRIARRSRETALVSDSTPSPPLAEPSAVAGAPTVSTAAPSPAPASAPATGVRASAPTAPSGDGALSAEPRYRTKPKPDYPIPSQRRREEWTVLVNVQVQADGAPAAVSLNRSSGYPLLDRAALDAVRRSTFEPELAAGVPVASLHVIRLRFSLDDR
jgi:protein TonB